MDSAAVSRSRTRDFDKSESDVCAYSLLWVVENLIVDTVLGGYEICQIFRLNYQKTSH